MPKTPVFFSHDGGVDDYLSILLLMTMPDVEVLGIAVTDADCYIEPAVSATRKILDLMGRSDVTVARSSARGVNPFPREFRLSSYAIDLFPILNEREALTTPLAAVDAPQFIVDTLRTAPTPVTFLEVGPLTTLAEALKLDPGVAAKIARIVWMGGALNVPGNVARNHEPGHDVSAEWNVYWDPISAARIWATDIPVVLCPLDITNNVPITPDFIRALSRQRQYPISDLAGLCYSLVAFRPYFCWDVLTTAYVGRPDLFTLTSWETEVIATGSDQGRTAVRPGGRAVQALATVDKDAFFDYFLKQMAR
ncbi:MAG TPA: nucleoside hydrolase [Anaerolineales bacterium]|nr:nucleoside hydrolase [Anaerolineales bacterium]HRF47038.1 nucleoside hydrolase [Anaerolineales bacterium]